MWIHPPVHRWLKWNQHTRGLSRVQDLTTLLESCDVTRRQCFHRGVDISFSGSQLLASLRVGKKKEKNKKKESHILCFHFDNSRRDSWKTTLIKWCICCWWDSWCASKAAFPGASKQKSSGSRLSRKTPQQIHENVSRIPAEQFCCLPIPPLVPVWQKWPDPSLRQPSWRWEKPKGLREFIWEVRREMSLCEHYLSALLTSNVKCRYAYNKKVMSIMFSVLQREHLSLRRNPCVHAFSFQYMWHATADRIWWNIKVSERFRGLCWERADAECMFHGLNYISKSPWASPKRGNWVNFEHWSTGKMHFPILILYQYSGCEFVGMF